MRVFNPDGSEAEMSGNGIRLFSKFVLDNKIVEFNSKELEIETLGGIRTVFPKMQKGKMISGKVAMGIPKFKCSEIPVLKDEFSDDKIVFDYILDIEDDSLEISCVNIGNPHLVFFSKNLNLINLNIYGPQIENHELFPQKTNVEIVEIINNKTIRMKVWERGAGITLACGSGACAAVYASTLKKYTEENVEVRFPEGSLQIKIKDNQAIMTGPAEINYKDHLEI